MTKVTRHVSLSARQVEMLGPENRSKAISLSIAKAIVDPNRLLAALAWRLSGAESPDSDFSLKTSMSLPVAVSNGLDLLATHCGLPVEHVMRLCLDAEYPEAKPEIAHPQVDMTSKSSASRIFGQSISVASDEGGSGGVSLKTGVRARVTQR